MTSSATSQKPAQLDSSRNSPRCVHQLAMSGTGYGSLANWTLFDFNFTSDCYRTAKFYVSRSGLRHLSSKSSPFPYAEFIDFVRYAAPDPFANVSRGAIVDWIDGLDFGAKSGRQEHFWNYDLTTGFCDPVFCQSMEWQGNPDLAGIGVGADNDHYQSNAGALPTY